VPVSNNMLASFVPDVLAQRIGLRSGPPSDRPAEVAELAVLGMDISEFTSITEDLVRWSAEGPEAAADTLNRVFSLMSEVVVEHHGSVLKLAGDEVLAVWVATEAGGLAAAAVWAARTALAIQDRIGGLAPVGGYPIRLRAGIGAGRVWLLDIGHQDGRRLFASVGPAIDEMARAQKAVAPSEVGLGEVALEQLWVTATTEPAGGRSSARRLIAVDPAAGFPLPAHRPHVAVPSALAARYVPNRVVERLSSESGDLLPEITSVTAVFVSLRAGPWDDDTTRVLTEASLQVLDVLEKHEATIVDAGQDQDGLTLVAGFGLSPATREREATRAVLAALELSRVLRGFVEHGIGIATGYAFCGVCGGPAYRQYTMVGPVINLAARLMQRAQNEVLCDQVSQHLSRDRIRFSDRGRMDVKGFASPVEVHRPEWHDADRLPALRRLADESGQLVTRGRGREREELAGRLVALGLGTSSAVVVEGEPGMGKTHLALDLLLGSGGYGPVNALAGGGDDVDPRPYHAWQRIFTKVLGLSSVHDPERRALLVQERLARLPGMESWAPLLDDVLGLVSDNSSLREMTGRARRENTVRVLVQLLAEAAGRTPLLIILDDCQWMDSASWELVRAVHRDVAPVMLVLLKRPAPETSPSPEGGAGISVDVITYLGKQNTLWMRLEPLPPDDTEEIARDFLGVTTLDEPLRSLFRGKVDGSPLFTVELAFQLRADEFISVVTTTRQARALLAVPSAELGRLRLPIRVEEVFRVRLGALSERQRTVIRAASVVGTSFDEKRVLGADPGLEEGDLTTDLRELERRNVIQAEPDGWRFTHALLRDVVKQSFLPSELRERHRALATWYESHEPDAKTYVLLARHWADAGDPVREVEYLEAAATNALATGADEEAASLLRTALLIDAGPPRALPAVSDTRRAFWHDELGEALADQNRLDEAVDHFRTALALLRHRVPASRLGWLARLVREVLVQVLHLLAAPRPLRGPNAMATGQAAWIFAKLAETYYFKASVLPWMATVLASVNLAERAGHEGVASPAYSGLANLVGTMRLHRLAARYFRRSRSEMHVQPTGSANPLTHAVLPDRAWQYGLTATVSEAVYLRTMNRGVDVIPMLDGVLEEARTFGHGQDLEVCLAVRGMFQETSGMLRLARADFEELLISARRRGNVEHIIWGMALLVPVLVSLDHRDEALALDDEASAIFSDEYSLAAPIFHGSHVQALVLRGHNADALAHARRALRDVGTPSFLHLPGLTALAQACLEMVHEERGSDLDGEARQVGRQALRALRGYTRIYPFARARYELSLGRYRAAQGKQQVARRDWARGLRAADGSGLHLDGARMRLLLADQLPEGAVARTEYLRQARLGVDELGLRRLKEFQRLMT
jgi:class 3 adenylate cyclase/tetratricopeptide (TPR) repeat protein